MIGSTWLETAEALMSDSQATMANNTLCNIMGILACIKVKAGKR